MAINMKLDTKKFEGVKEVQLELLLELDRICKKNDIHYNIYFGTMLGAIRHQGFIPWDDDLDVAMTRENYEKFLSVSSNDVKEDYFVQNSKTDPEFFRPFTRIRKNGTVYKQYRYRNLNIHHGVFIDVFPFDSVYGSKDEEVSRYMYLEFLYKLNYIKHTSMDDDANIFKKAVQRIVDLIIPTKKFNQYITNILIKRNKENTGYINHMSNATPLFQYDSTIIKEEDFLDSILCDFEGYKFPIPRTYDRCLTQNYGDYMELPPKEERTPHHGVVEIEL